MNLYITSFKEYCDKLYENKPKYATHKPKPLNFRDKMLYDQIQKERLKQFIDAAILDTKQAREYACQTVANTFKKEVKLPQYSTLPQYQKKLNIKPLRDPQFDLSFDSWRRIDSISQKRSRTRSVLTSKAQPRTITRW